MVASMELSNAKNRAKEHKYLEAVDSAVSSLAKSEYQSTEAADLILEIVMTGDAYYNSNIKQYRNSNKGNALAGIYNNYIALVKLYNVVANNNLQNFIAGGRNYSIDIIDYSSELNTARDEAGKIYYDAAVSNMNKETLEGYRQAYTNLDFVKSMYSNIQSPFGDLDNRLKKAKNEGTIDIYIVVPANLKMDEIQTSMGDLVKQDVTKQSKWVEYHYGTKVDMAYQAWEIVVAGEQLIDSATGKVNNSNGVLQFGREVGADIVIYAAFDQLKSEKINVKNFNNVLFDSTNSEGEAYVGKVAMKKYSKKTSLNYSYYVVDVKSGKALAQGNNKKMSQDIVLYAGTYTITPNNIWMIQNTMDFAKSLNINDIKEYRYVKAGYNGWVYRTNYDGGERAEGIKKTFDEQKASFEHYAENEAQYIMVGKVTDAISKSIANLL